ncbi:MAG TPA: hypothetical protein V6D28_12635 [Leptolyngbyaceae cyanobacterium]
MNNFDRKKWENVKILAARLQAIKSILEIFNLQTEEQSFALELNSIREQLEADFEKTLDELLVLIDEDEE